MQPSSHLPTLPLLERELGAFPERRWRTITTAEAVVVRDALAHPDFPANHRLRASGLARRTYQTAYRRVYGQRWLRDRFVPNPAAFGFSSATMVVAQPYADTVRLAAADWRTQERVVVCWTGTETIFGVLFNRYSPDDNRIPKWLQDSALYQSVYALTIDARRPTVPVYFDFEGEWARYSGLQGLVGYPHPLPWWRNGAAARDASTPTPPVLRAGAALITDHLHQPPRTADGSWNLSSMGWGSLRERCVSEGWV